MNKILFVFFMIILNINVYATSEEKGILTKLDIKGYDINFSSDIHEYSITTSSSKPLDIEYELYNTSSYVQITGNGNFNHSKNIITINIDNVNTYTINVYKTNNVSKEIIDDNDIKEMSYAKKEIVKIILITISCSIIFYLYYLLFIKKLF